MNRYIIVETEFGYYVIDTKTLHTGQTHKPIHATQDYVEAIEKRDELNEQ